MSVCNQCGEEIEFRYVNGRFIPIHINGNYCRGYKIKHSNQHKVSNSNISYQWDYPHIKKIEDYPSYVNPNVECRCCGKPIHFYQSPYGGKVFFESPLGPPWIKHCCDKEKCCTSQGKNPKSATTSISNVRKIKDWKPYFVIKSESLRIKKTGLKTIYLKSLFNNLKYKFYIEKDVDIQEESLVFIKKISENYWELSFYTINSSENIIISDKISTDSLKEFKEKYLRTIKKNRIKAQNKKDKSNIRNRKNKSWKNIIIYSKKKTK